MVQERAGREEPQVPERRKREQAFANERNRAGETRLFVAVKNGNIKEVKSLVAKGADVNKGQSDITPLHGAAAKGYIDIAKYLVSEGAEINALATAFGYPTTPLDAALMTNKTKMAQYLASVGGRRTDASDLTGTRQMVPQRQQPLRNENTFTSKTPSTNSSTSTWSCFSIIPKQISANRVL